MIFLFVFLVLFLSVYYCDTGSRGVSSGIRVVVPFSKGQIFVLLVFWYNGGHVLYYLLWYLVFLEVALVNNMPISGAYKIIPLCLSLLGLRKVHPFVCVNMVLVGIFSLFVCKNDPNFIF